jgi:hypothetical protein
MDMGRGYSTFVSATKVEPKRLRRHAQPARPVSPFASAASLRCSQTFDACARGHMQAGLPLHPR